MKWIGLTGGIATGKSTVAKILRDMGKPVLDADGLAREVTKVGSEALIEIRKNFGDAVFESDGNLDRKKLGKIVFSDTNKRNLLEQIIHPRIQELKATAKVSLENEGAPIAFYEVPLLFEKNLQNDFDATIVVHAGLEQQKQRMKERDGLSEDEINKRLSAQLPMEDKLKKADYVILNKGSLPELKQSVLQVLHDIEHPDGVEK